MKTAFIAISMFGILALSGCKSLCEQAAQKELQCLQGYCSSHSDNPFCAEVSALPQEANQACDSGWAQDTMDMDCEEMERDWARAQRRNEPATTTPQTTDIASPEGTGAVAPPDIAPPEGTGAVAPPDESGAETGAATPTDEPSGEVPPEEPEVAPEEAPPTTE
jgi:hypothetical protein